MSSTESSVILKTPEDWDAWNKQFKAEAKRKKLLEQVEGTASFRTMPKEPDLKKFLPQGVRTRSTGSSTAASSATEVATPEPTTADLTIEGRGNYQLAYTIYKDQRDQYDSQQDSLDKLQTWMTKTVASSYVETCFDYKKDITDWYNTLKQQVGTNEYAIKREIKDIYRRAIKPLSKIPKDIESWITNWEQVMAKGQERSLSFATNVDEWFEDFLAAVNTIEPMWTKAYRLTKSEEVEKGTLSYRTLANDFRKAVKALRTDARTSRVAKGSFGPTFAGQSAEEETDASDASTKVPPGKKRRTGKQKPDSQEATGPGKGKRRHSRANSLPTGRTKCRACEQRHDFSTCYYLFPGKAPKGFKPSEIVKRRVEQNLKEDHGLSEEVKRLQKSMDDTTISNEDD